MFVGVNQRFCNLIGYSEIEALDLDWRDLIVPEEIAPAERAIERGPEMEAVRWHWRKKGGEVFSVTLSAREMLFVNDDGTISKAYIALVLSTGDDSTISGEAAFSKRNNR